MVKPLSHSNIFSNKKTQLVKFYKNPYKINNVQYKIDEINKISFLQYHTLNSSAPLSTSIIT